MSRFSRVTSATSVPKGPHFMILVFKREGQYRPGDERSRTHPGHGYPEGVDYIDTTDVYCFTNKASLLKELERLYDEKRDRQDIVILQVTPLQPSVKLDIQL